MSKKDLEKFGARDGVKQWSKRRKTKYIVTQRDRQTKKDNYIDPLKSIYKVSRTLAAGGSAQRVFTLNRPLFLMRTRDHPPGILWHHAATGPGRLGEHTAQVFPACLSISPSGTERGDNSSLSCLSVCLSLRN